MVSWRLEATGPRPDPAVHTAESSPSAGSAGTVRRARFAGCPMDVPVLQRSGLEPEIRLEGPALVEERETTTVVPPGAEFRADGIGNLRIRIGSAG